MLTTADEMDSAKDLAYFRERIEDLSEETTMLAALLDSDIDETIFENIEELVERTLLHSSSGPATVETLSQQLTFSVPDRFTQRQQERKPRQRQTEAHTQAAGGRLSEKMLNKKGGVHIRSIMQFVLSALLLCRTESMALENAHILPAEDSKLVLNWDQKDYPADCSEIFLSSNGGARDGLYMIQPMKTVIVVFCDMQDGGWTVFQHITVNSSVDFDRTWHDYKLGFGAVSGDHWLGNEYLYQLTNRGGVHKLRIKLVNMDAVTKVGEYDPFIVESEASQYKIRLGLYKGNAVDALTQDTEAYLHDNQRFTTKDQDNDNYFQNCAKLEYMGVPGGGWWYDACAGANLNRRNVIYWQKDCNKEHLCKYAWMMVKPSEKKVPAKSENCQRDEL
ncbi:FGL1L protein, partial [Polypterus senegalus]